MGENSIKLKNIKFLSGKNFFIPDYQRGYRWTSTEVCKMLDDFYEFLLRKNRNTLQDGEFYCLQPIVIKNREDLGKDWYEVIDGQQRLTTLFLILKALSSNIDLEEFNFSPYHIVYQTRQTDIESDLLSTVGTDEFDPMANVDSYYMDVVYRAIVTWMSVTGKNFGGRLKSKLAELLLEEDLVPNPQKGGEQRDLAHNVRIIWYDAEEKKGETSVGIFTRLNIGKIALNNAELIKALFLKKNRYSDAGMSAEEKLAIDKELSLKQILISEEWNGIEQRLQDDSFWYFLRRSSDKTEYETRIEFIFDLMSGKIGKEASEFYHTFYYFNDQFSSAPTVEEIEKEWTAVKKYFRELEYWYNDRRLFHLIGFLIEIGVGVNDIMDMAYLQTTEEPISFVKDESGEKIRLDKDKFLSKIRKRIRAYMSDVDIDRLKYGDGKMRPTLLLFNILTVAESNRSDIKFPFDKYKTEEWDKEHIASQKEHDETPRNNKQRSQWIDDMLLYFCGVSADDIFVNDEADNDDASQEGRNKYGIEQAENWIKKESEDENSDISEEVLQIVRGLIDAKRMSLENDKNRDSKAYEDVMIRLFEAIQKYFDADKLSDSKKDTIGNMALLNASINRSYKNALFPIKRMHIKRNDSMGVFVPIATKNVFLKYYSKSIDNMMYWTDADADSYMESIKNTLRKYLK